MGDGMRGLKIAIVIMGVLIVAGVTALIFLVVSGTAARPGTTSVLLEEPDGTRIVGSSAGQGQVVVQLQGGGPDRVVIVDLRSGRTVGRVGLSR